MSMILSVHSTKAFREFLLPAVNNTENSIILDNEIFSLDKDLELKMEIIENSWHFVYSENYIILDTVSRQEYFGIGLKDGDLLSIILPGREQISIMADETENSFKVYEKYDISTIRELRIGKNKNNDIVYDTRRLVSGEHALIVNEESSCTIVDKSTNGVFVNSRRIDHKKQLEFGDRINIFRLSLVYLGDVLAVNAPNGSFHAGRMKEYEEPEFYETAETVSAGPHKKTVFHRSPRTVYKIDDSTVEIEAPPNAKALNRKPLPMIIGPSFTMAIPMLLGSGLAIYSMRARGSSGSAFMYTGIITAVSSALIGILWALINLRHEKKKHLDQELHRFEAYGQYLVRCSAQIREKYEKDISGLRTMYPSAAVCCGYNAQNALLWNRNDNHHDFLSHRLGTGDQPFQVQIQIPKERFTLINDSLAEKPAMIQQHYKYLHNVPVCIDLSRHRIIGIVGGEKKKGALELMHTLAAQIAASNCYTDVKMAFLFDEGMDDSDDWEYMKWLPHVWSEDKKTRYMAKNRREAGDVLYEITNILRTRAENRQSYSEKNAGLTLPQFLLFFSDPKLMEGELITKYITDKNNCDVITVFLTDQYENLPNECRYIIQNDETFQGMYGTEGNLEDRVPVSFDHVTNSQLEKFCRMLADIEVTGTKTSGELPGSLTFFDMYGIKRLEELNVLDRWRKNRNYDSMRALIGQKSGGTDWYLDAHEKYHGPHGLVAGTTGSGKSEILQTYILSLAISFSPDDIAFFIIDYKGGGMANLFTDLPHMAGQISNLSGGQVKRAMVSIKSENKRRQRVFNEHGVNNINLYTRLYKNNEANQPVPHMFIIIDEFAELKREEPDFMHELISVAQVGRSLGVHLILATQKPSGTVDDNIWSNSKFRLCLRVQDRQDSNDMLHKPDAAYITNAGRCYMQVGNDELYELFQSGFSGAPYDEESGSLKSEIAQMASTTGKASLAGSRQKLRQQETMRRNWIRQLLDVIFLIPVPEQLSRMQLLEDNQLLLEYVRDMFELFSEKNIDYPYSAYNEKRLIDFITALANVEEYCGTSDVPTAAEQVIQYAKLNGLKLPERKQKTQLDAVVEYLAVLAKQNGFVNHMQLWLPPLSDAVYLNELPSYQKQELFDGKSWHREKKAWDLEVLMGLYDDPENQAQDCLTLSLSENGHHAVVGTVVSGKSTFLQTFVYSLVMKYTPAEVNIYAIDYSAKMLSAFEKMPHVGGIMYENDDDKLAKFFNMLGVMLEERKKLFRGGNYSQYVRANGIVIPAVLLVIDNYSNFRNKTNSMYDEKILQLSKDGVSHGIFLVITGGGFQASEIPARIADNFRTVICLEMGDKFKYAEAMRMTRIETIPEPNIKGRGLAKIGGQLLEFQTALSFRAEDDFKRMEGIAHLSGQMQNQWTGRPAKAVPQIPENPVWSEFAALEDTEKLFADDRHLPIGYNAQNAAPYGIDLSRTYCYLITGKSRSGKTNLLKAMIYAALSRSMETVIIDYSGELADLAEKKSIPVLSDDHEILQYFEALIPDIKERNEKKHEYMRKDMSDEEIYVHMRSFVPKFIFVADLAEFIDRVVKAPTEFSVKRFVENLLNKGSLHNVFWAACYNKEDFSKAGGTQIYDYFLRYKTGIHFGGNVGAYGIMNFDYVPLKERSKPQKVGVGMLPYNDEENVHKVIVPLVKG